MKIQSTIIILLNLFSFTVFCQDTEDADSTDIKKWNFNAELNTYIFSDYVLAMPILRVDHNWLHLEGRYNYEDYKTASFWAGYNFEGGNEFEYIITPMAGIVTGNIDGYAPGIETTFIYKNFELYSEFEYFFDKEVHDNDYAYLFSDLTYTIKDKYWLGISSQRTRLYKSDLELQRGIVAGMAIKNWELSGYIYNLFDDSLFGFISVGYIY